MSVHDNKTVINVTAEYDRAIAAAKEWQCGEQPNIEKLVRAAYMHGYVAGHRDGRAIHPTGTPP